MRDAASSEVGHPSDNSKCEDDVQMLRGALAELPDDQRAALSLHYLDGLSVREIARVLGVPQGTVKSRLYYARNSLKKALERVKS
jgi:RNA polymerase sigma-70 factor (ECF subfamily)